MIKAVLIDDERPALRGLEFMLKKCSQVEVTGAFTDPIEGIEKMEDLKPDIVFLDINMPRLDGIDAVSCILEVSPDTEIVFVTAYDEYAIKAFELNALDYLLKPIEIARLEVTLDRLRKKLRAKSTQQLKFTGKMLKLRCLGCFEIGFEDCAPIKWRAEKTKELFAFLLHHARREITKDEILDNLWQNDDPDKAIKQLYNGIYYIRKTLANYGIDRRLLSIDGNYHLRICSVDYDIERFLAFYKQKSNRIDTLERMEALYVGDYLGTLCYDWAIIEKNRLLEMYICCAIELSGLYIQSKMYDEAACILRKAYQKDPLSENVTQSLLMLYRQTENKPAAVRHYTEYFKMLKKELGITPAEPIRRLSDWF